MKSHKNTSHYKQYMNLSEENKEKILNIIKEYKSNYNMTATIAAELVEKESGILFDRKKFTGLIAELGISPKDKVLVNRGRQQTQKELKQSEYEEKIKLQIDILKKNGIDRELFTQIYNTNPLSYFMNLGINVHSVKNIANYWGIEKVTKQYTYKTLEEDLTNNGVSREEVIELYINKNYPTQEVIKYLNKKLNRRIGNKIFNNLMKSWGIKKSKSQIKELQGSRGRETFQDNLNKLMYSDFTLSSLAKYYDNNLNLTKYELLKTLNGNLPSGVKPLSLKWLDVHLTPLLNNSRPTNRSRIEREFANFLLNLCEQKSITETLIMSSRKIIEPMELDFFIPELNVAIEFNGDYWHSSSNLLSNTNLTSLEYHTLKHLLCKHKGITLLYVWESDWVYSQEEVKSALVHFFNTGETRDILCKFENEK